MTEAENIGTALERRQRRRFRALLLGGLAVSVALGLAGHRIADANGAFAPGPAVLVALAFAMLVLLGTWIYFRAADEIEWANNLNACFWGFNAFMVGWPVWFILWKGGLVPAPEGTAVYGGSAAVALAAYLWRRLR